MLFSLTFLGLPEKVSAAGEWGTADIFGDFVLNMLMQIRRQMEGSVIGALKMAAVQMLNQQVGQLIGGGAGGQPRIITNFNDFLYQGPRQRADLYMDDFFKLTTRGRGSAANYISVGGTGGIGGGYTQYLESVGRQATVEAGAPCAIDLGESANAGTWAEEGDFRGLNAFVSNPCNNPYGYALEAEDAYNGELMRQQEAAKIEATSSGVLPVEEGGNVIAPAASVEAMMVKIQTLPVDIIANATNPAELMGGVVSSIANEIVGKLMRDGVGMVQTNMQRQIRGVNVQVSAALGQATGRSGPGAIFNSSVIQQSIGVNPSTSAPPPVTSGGD